MSNVSALNRAILAGQRLEVANAAMTSLNNAYVVCRGSSMPSALQDALCNAERELVKHIDQLRDAYEVAHRIAQETKNFRVSDNVYEVRKELQPVLCSTELTALKSIIAALQGE